MNILVRHTLNSVLRNPVQSLIVVASTAMITACILMCMCISSMFEQIAAQWADRTFAGADIITAVYTDENIAAVTNFIDAHSEEVQDYYFSDSASVNVITETASVRGLSIVVYDIEEFDRLTSAKVLARTDNPSEHPSAHISTVLADRAGLSLGDTFTLNNGRTCFVSAIVAPTARYFDQQAACFAYEYPTEIQLNTVSIYLKDPYAVTQDGQTVWQTWQQFFYSVAGAGNTKTNVGYVDSLVQDSTDGSMQLMTVAAAVISVVMACLLFSSFSVIVRGRVNELIKFKAAGATPAQSAFILILEAAVYALIGGLIGLGVGEGLIQYLNSLLGELIVGATLATPAYKYIAALFIGAGCGLAACALPCVRMSRKSIQSLIGGDERMTRKPPLLVAVLLTLLTVACGVSLFFVDGMTLNVLGILLIALTFVWIITSMPHFLSFAARAAAKLSRHGAAYVAMCAAPRNASVSSSLTMLAALITFITLGTGIIGAVRTTSVPSSTRYNSDYIVRLSSSMDTHDRDTLFTALEKARSVEGITRAGLLALSHANDISHAGESAPPPESQLISIFAVSDAAALSFICPGIDEETVRRFDEAEHPVILTRTVAERYGIDVGDLTTLYASGYPCESAVFTVVGIDETATSYDDYIFITVDDLARVRGWNFPGEVLIMIDGDSSALSALRTAFDSHSSAAYTRDGYFSAEGKDKLDTEDLIGMFTFIIYGIAGLGLINLIVITAGSRKKEFDVLRLAGLTPAGAAAYISAETGVLAAVGFSVGLIAAFFANRASAAVARLIGEYFTPEAFPTFMIAIAAALTAVFILLWALSHATSFLQVSSPRYRTRDDRSLRAN